ncbi:fumarylacetoacetate hydrolase family protein [Salibacteraceae bacterium]|nr:fumarylacetoacetate hydrolase family protein [Salibacteraceae bacterium]
MSNINEAALQLRNSSKTKTTCSPVRNLIGATDIESAYKVQEINIAERINRGAKPVGSKVGLTSFAVQKQLGVDQPDFGVLLDDMVVEQGGTVDYNLLMQPKVEAEVAFVLKSDLPSVEISEAALVDAIDYAVASIEIVGSRVENWDIHITDTIADNASASHFVLGTQHVNLADLDLVGCEMKLWLNEEIVSEGKGEACMGSPINAALWLANTMVKRGKPLKAGDVILSGALGPMAPVKPGDKVRASIEGLGDVAVNFSTI